MPFEANRKFDLTVDGKLVHAKVARAGQESLSFTDLPVGPKVVEIWLDHTAPVAVRGLAVEDGAELVPAGDGRPKWITYGSSITHCGSAHSPARTWPACVAREAKLDLTCLGYGGNCHIEPMVARMIRDLPADFISLKLGINVQGASSLSPRTFQPAVIGFVQILRERHPDISIAVISPIVSPPRETMPNAAGLSLTTMREQLADAVERMRACGDRNLYYFDGLTLFGQDLVEKYLPDMLHPNGDGYEVLGRSFLKVVLPQIPLHASTSEAR